MANRRIAKGHRLARKKKLKTTKKSSQIENGIKPATLMTAAASLYTNAGTKRRLATTTHTRVVRNSARRQQQQRFTAIEAFKRQKSKLLKQQAAERMVLKEHLRELEARKDRIRRGDTAKTERRELAKYIRQLKQEQQVKHVSELQNVEAELKRLMEEHDKVCAARAAAGTNEEEVDWEDMGDADDGDVDEDQLQQMFAHLTV